MKKLKDIYSPVNGYKAYRALPTEPVCLPALAIYLRDLTLALDGNQLYTNDMKTSINFERMRLIADRVLELHSIDTSNFTGIIGDPVLKRHLAKVN